MTTLVRRLVPALLLTPLLFAACGSDGDALDPAVGRSRADIVTYLGTDTQSATFEYLGRNDSAPLTLVAHGMTIPQAVKAGQRVMLYYDWAGGASAGSYRGIDAFAMSTIVSDSLRVSDRPVTDFVRHAVRLRSIWRTADYVNMHCEVEYTGVSRHFFLLLDPATRSDDTVHTYLVHNPWTDTLRHWRTTIASFNVAAVWNRPSCRVLRVHLSDTLRPDVTHYDFVKPSMY